MEYISKQLEFVIELFRAEAVLGRALDARLGGVGFTEFIILFHLTLAEGEKLRRVDLATKLGLTPSGVTRLLLPMEKIGLVKKVADQRDARVSHVQLARGGRQKFEEALERAELFVTELQNSSKLGRVTELTKALKAIA